MEVEECLVQGVSATCSYLKRLSNRAVSLGLPVPVASQWSMKGIALRNEFHVEAVSGENVDKCYNCALSFRNVKSFKIIIEPPSSGTRQVVAVCKGCDYRMQCGFLNLNNDDESMTCTAEISVSANHKSTTTPKPSTPALSRVIGSENSSQKNRNNKRRGSALEKLMKAEESEADRSLGAFLNSFSG